MRWKPPRVNITPRLRTAYRLLNFFEKRFTKTSSSGKRTYIEPKIQHKIDKIHKTIKQEQYVLLEFERSFEPIFQVLGNSTVATGSKILQLPPPEDSNFP